METTTKAAAKEWRKNDAKYIHTQVRAIGRQRGETKDDKGTTTTATTSGKKRKVEGDDGEVRNKNENGLKMTMELDFKDEKRYGVYII